MLEITAWGWNLQINTRSDIFTPKKMSIEDIAIADQPHIHEVDEISLSQCFHEIITKKRIVPIYSWMLMVRNYIFLTENEYLPTNPLLSKDCIEQMANDFSLEEISDFIDKKGGFDHLRRYGLSSMNQDPYMNIFLKNMKATLPQLQLNHYAMQLLMMDGTALIPLKALIALMIIQGSDLCRLLAARSC